MVFFICLLSGLSLKGQFDPLKICRIENNRLVFTIDQNWSDREKKEVEELFDLDSAFLVKIFNGAPFLKIGEETWEVKTIKPGRVEISVMMAPTPPALSFDFNDVLMIENSWMANVTKSETQTVIYGVNDLESENLLRYGRGIARFYLPGRQEARKVFLSGSFNNWSTMQSPMTQTDTGWIIDLRLSPGKYRYKYIVDGKWTQDPNNRIREDDTHGGFNSILYLNNYVFRLRGYPNARNVLVSGSFNNWNEKELKMKPVGDGWELPIYLREGTHAYKFIVDRQWILDPANPVTRPDGSGNINSFMAIGDTLVFRLNGYPDARKVNLAGSFNAWNSGELFMLKDSTGWFLPYVLAPGNYEYKFIVDGNWIPDPAAEFSTGIKGQDNSYLTFRPNHVFELDSFPDAKTVIITGNFNNWRTDNFQMIRKDKKWIFPLYLEPGKCLYKFIVDGTWILDPKNELWEENEYGTGNSILWVEP